MQPDDIRALRAAYGLTREEFARAIGVTKQTIYFWEHGKYYPARYDSIVLYKLWAMLHNPEERKIAKNALFKAKTLPPEPSIEEKKGGNIGAFLSGELIGFGLGLILQSLFGGKKNNE